MMNKFWFLVGNSFKKKAKSKWFFIVNIILMVAIVGIMNIDSIIKFFGGDFDDTKEIVVLDKTSYSTEIFKNSLNTLNDSLDMGYSFNVVEENKTLDELKEEVKENGKVLVVFDNDPNSYIKASVISKSHIDTAYYQILYQSLATTKSTVALSLTSIDPEELQKLTSQINVERIILNEGETSEEESTEMIMGTVFPTVILPFFILVIFLVQMIGAEINEEKQTRSMEVIISNVSPKTHFFSKVVASNGFVLMQGLLLITYAIIALVIRNTVGTTGASSGITDEIGNVWNTVMSSGIGDKLVIIIPCTLFLMILSFIAYSLVAGILASMTVSMEDYQQIQTPIVMVSLLGYYLSIMAGLFKGSILIRILSYVPFISCLLSPALLVIGQISVIDVLISILVLFALIFVLVKYGLKIYKIGILNYSTDKMWSKLFKAIKSKE